ncbi:hypothetical protein RBA63_13970 [Brenneria goodwinii]|uniref:hypothetical protein n=1 Tax=Brenneria goodwinii TaxID=1109412 RepID=UPI0036E8BB47
MSFKKMILAMPDIKWFCSSTNASIFAVSEGSWRIATGLFDITPRGVPERKAFSFAFMVVYCRY